MFNCKNNISDPSGLINKKQCPDLFDIKTGHCFNVKIFQIKNIRIYNRLLNKHFDFSL